MKIITVSREFGSGGRELGKRLADLLGFDYYDREIIAAISKNRGLDEKYVETALNNQGWRNIPLTFRHSFTGSFAGNSAQIDILLERKRILEEITALGRDCVIVGQSADVILAEAHPFNIFVCANIEARIRRCEERAEEGENLSRRQIEQNIRRIDKNRAKNRELLTDLVWGDRRSYHLILNTTDWEIKALAPLVGDFVTRYWEAKQ